MYLISIHVLLMPRLFRPRAYIQIYSNTRNEEKKVSIYKISRYFFWAGTNSPLEFVVTHMVARNTLQGQPTFYGNERWL